MNIQLPAHMDKPSFLAWLQGREGRYELVEGRVQMMTGGTMAHGLITGNVFQMLRARLDRKMWAVLTEFGVDVGPGSIRYPDVVVVNRRGTKAKDLRTTAPVFLVEVLSPSTAAIDLRDKAAEYLALSSIGTYLVLSQDEVKACVYAKGVDHLRPHVVDGPDDKVSVPSRGIDLPLSEIYSDVEFN